MEFRWNAWNVEHIERHGVSPDEAEFVVNRARRPFPELIRDNTWYVAGRTLQGHYLQVIYTLDPDDTVYVIHARPLTEHEKRKYRRRIK